MRKILLISVLALLSFSGWSQIDSVKLAKLSESTRAYLTAIQRESIDFKKEECRFLIESCTDSTLKQHVALDINDFYKNSNVMGDEAICVFLYDEWFGPKMIPMKSDMDLYDAQMFAEFNRHTLIGMKAPEVTLQDMYGNDETIPVEGSYSVIYLYDTDCAKCRMESILLRKFLESTDIEADFHAVYAGHDKDKWEDYVQNLFDVNSSNVRMHHLWDGKGESDVLHLYGVLQTPRMYLVDPQGTILGRGLDVESLEQLLGYARFYREMFKRCEIGSKVPGFKVPATLRKGAREKEGKFRFKRADYVIFHTEGCIHCQAELEAMEEKLGGDATVMLVNVDRVADLDHDLMKALLDSFDLSTLPFIMKLDRKGVVLDRYITFLSQDR